MAPTSVPTSVPTTPATTTPPSPEWTPPNNVRAVLDRVEQLDAGRMVLTVYDHEGKERERVGDLIGDDLGSPLGWLRCEVYQVVWWHREQFTHARVRLWRPDGRPVTGAKFPLPSVDEIPPDPTRTLQRLTTPAAARAVTTTPHHDQARASGTTTTERRLRAEVGRLSRTLAQAKLRANHLDRHVESLTGRLRERDEELRRLKGHVRRLEREKEERNREAMDLVAAVESLWQSQGAR